MKSEQLLKSHQVANRAKKDKHMKNGMHELLLVQCIEQGASYEHHAFGKNPQDTRVRNIEPHDSDADKNAATHQHKADSLEMAVLLQLEKREDDANQGGRLNPHEQSPPPGIDLPESPQSEGCITASNVKINAGMVKLAQPLTNVGALTQRMINGGRSIRGKHAKHIQDKSGNEPSRIFSRACDDKTTPHKPH